MTNIVKKSEIFNSMQGRHKYWFYLIRFIFATAGRKRSESWLTQTAILVLFTHVLNNTFSRLIAFEF